MRWDMFKVIVERPRKGGGAPTSAYERSCRSKHQADAEHLHDLEIPRCEGMKRRHHTKWLNEHLGPLQRFLVRRAGQPWDAVFSEICAALKLDSTVQRHVREHLEDFVAIHASRNHASEVIVHDRYGRQMPIEQSRVSLYVDPDTNILTRCPGMHRKQARKLRLARITAQIAAWRREVPDNPHLQFHKARGHWYRVRLRKLPTHERVWDALHGCVASAEHPARLQARYGRAGVYAFEKKQASRKELKLLGVRNGGPCCRHEVPSRLLVGQVWRA